jgi:flagellar hook-associated protein 1
MSLNSILGISINGMFTASNGMQTASHNIANVNTEGFSRQTVMIGTRNGLSTSYGMMGGGSTLLGIRRNTDEFLLARVREQSSQLTEYDQIDRSLQDIEMVFGSVENDHLGSAMSNFFDAWSELASAPTNGSLRESVLVMSQNLVRDFNSMSDSLTDMGEDLDKQIGMEVANVNSILDSVSQLNKQILVAESNGTVANDLRDTRDLMMQRLSELAHAESIERDDGTIDVVISGRTMVSRNNVEYLHLDHVVDRSGDEPRTVITTGRSDHLIDMPQGAIAGMIKARDDKILNAREELDVVAKTLMDRVNSLHVEGHTGNGTGQLFFTGDTAGTMAISDFIANDTANIATSRSGLSGDMDIAREIAALGAVTDSSNSSATIQEMYSSLVIQLASDAQASQNQIEVQYQVVDALAQRLESQRGVSLDEEAVNISLYQNAYEANARMIAAAQEMFDTLLTMI